MPALTMRGRYIMREYWGDSDLFLRLTPQEREVYVGLWMLADDAGWMPRDVPAIAAALYRYEDRAPREAIVSDVLTKLRDMGKIEGHRCCVYLPSVERYPRAGKKSTEHRENHVRHSNRNERIQTDTNPSPVPSLRNPSLPVVADAPEPNGTGGASLKDLVGWKP
jgi:hypothetical protein